MASEKFLDYDGLSHFVGKIKPTLSHSIMTGITTTAGSASSPYLSVKWSVSNVDGITTPYNGMRIAVKIPMTGVGTAGVILSIDGGTTWHPVAYNINTVLTTHYPLNSVKYLTYDANQSMTGYITAGTATSITGVWKCDADYDSTNLYADYLLYSGARAGSNGIMRNSLIMRKSDDTYESFTTTNGTGTGKTINTSGFYPGELYYYSPGSNLDAGGTIGTGHAYAFYTNVLDARFSFNCGTTLTAYKSLYVVGKIENGLFYLQSPYWAQDLPSTEDGKVYMLIGRTYDTYRYMLYATHPIYWYKDGAVQLYSFYENTTYTANTSKLATTSIGSASAGTAIPADDITAWSAGTATTPAVIDTSKFNGI